MASDRAVVCLVCRYFSGDRRGAFLHGRRTYGNGLSVHSRRGGGSGASYGDHSYVDEPYKIKAIKMYMVDYLENVCAVRVRRQNRKEKEFIDVIPSENVNGGGKVKEQKTFAGADDKKEGASAGTVPVQENRADRKENAKGAATMQETEYEQWRAQAVREI